MNEGFANYFENLGTAYVKPEYSYVKKIQKLIFCNFLTALLFFQIQQFKNSFFNQLRTHAVSNSRPISNDVGSPSEISAMFDSVSYAKVKCLSL